MSRNIPSLLLQYCEEVFKNPEAKRRHTGLVHFPEKHKCTICLRSCYSAFRLQLHMRTHSGRTFDCQECGKSLKSEEGLKIHMRLHTGDLFKCDYCSWQGNTRYAMHLCNGGYPQIQDNQRLNLAVVAYSKCLNLSH